MGDSEDPPFSIWSIVSSWVAELDSTPWLAPSIPFEELSAPPVYEVRYAELPDTNGVVVFYRRFFDGKRRFDGNYDSSMS